MQSNLFEERTIYGISPLSIIDGIQLIKKQATETALAKTVQEPSCGTEGLGLFHSNAYSLSPRLDYEKVVSSKCLFFVSAT